MQGPPQRRTDEGIKGAVIYGESPKKKKKRYPEPRSPVLLHCLGKDISAFATGPEKNEAKKLYSETLKENQSFVHLN